MNSCMIEPMKIAEIQEQKLDRQVGRINNEIYKKKEDK